MRAMWNILSSRSWCERECLEREKKKIRISEVTEDERCKRILASETRTRAPALIV